MQIYIDKGRSGKWYWKLKAENGKTLAHSESYSSKAKAWKTVQGLKLAFCLDKVTILVSGKVVNMLPIKA